ncbi:hypothetical protein C8R47DRAFT_1073167 [Mycena vitilis]|nr:hypothetical protein C8R47DRAFT_1073167 [Mycena vitilis]
MALPKFECISGGAPLVVIQADEKFADGKVSSQTPLKTLRLFVYGCDLGHPRLRHRECKKRRNHWLPFVGVRRTTGFGRGCYLLQKHCRDYPPFTPRIAASYLGSPRDRADSVLPRPTRKIGESRRRVERAATPIYSRTLSSTRWRRCLRLRTSWRIPTFAAEPPLVHRVAAGGRSGMAASRAAEVASSSVDRVIDDSTAVALPARFHLSCGRNIEAGPIAHRTAGGSSEGSETRTMQRQGECLTQTIKRRHGGSLSRYRSSRGHARLISPPAQDTHPTLDLIPLDAARRQELNAGTTHPRPPCMAFGSMGSSGAGVLRAFENARQFLEAVLGHTTTCREHRLMLKLEPSKIVLTILSEVALAALNHDTDNPCLLQLRQSSEDSSTMKYDVFRDIGHSISAAHIQAELLKVLPVELATVNVLNSLAETIISALPTNFCAFLGQIAEDMNPKSSSQWLAKCLAPVISAIQEGATKVPLDATPLHIPTQKEDEHLALVQRLGGLYAADRADLDTAIIHSFSLTRFNLSDITKLSIPASFWARPGATSPKALSAYALSGKTFFAMLIKRFVGARADIGPADYWTFVDRLTSDGFTQRLVKSTAVLLGRAHLDVAEVAEAFHTYVGAYLASTVHGELRFRTWLLQPLEFVVAYAVKTLAARRVSRQRKAAKMAAKQEEVKTTGGKPKSSKRAAEVEADAEVEMGGKAKAEAEAPRTVWSKKRRILPATKAPLSEATNSPSVTSQQPAASHPQPADPVAVALTKENRRVCAERSARGRHARRPIGKDFKTITTFFKFDTAYHISANMTKRWMN